MTVNFTFSWWMLVPFLWTLCCSMPIFDRDCERDDYPFVLSVWGFVMVIILLTRALP